MLSLSVYFPLLLLFQQSRKRSRSVSIENDGVDSETNDSGSVAGSSSNQVTDYFPASKLFEYQWPLGDEGAEHYMLQEQVKDFLDIRGIQRKYPGQLMSTVDGDIYGFLTMDITLLRGHFQTKLAS